MQEVYMQLPVAISAYLITIPHVSFFFWLIMAFLLLMVELGHPGLFLFVSFFIGALGAAGMAFIGHSFVMQVGCFLGGSVVAFTLLQSWIAKDQKHGYRSNVYALAGKEGIVIAEIGATTCGQVTIEGQRWRAQSYDGSVIVRETKVRILEVCGTRVIVKKIDCITNNHICS